MKNVVLIYLCCCMQLIGSASSENHPHDSNSEIFAPPTNDQCWNAMSLAVPSSYSGTTIEAATDFGAACNGSSGGGTGGNGYADVWFTFTGTGEEIELSVCHAGTVFDSKLALYEGPHCFDMTCVDANDDFGLDLGCYIGGSAKKSKITFLSVPGQTYFLRLDGYQPFDFGDYTITITELLPAPITLVDFWGDTWERGNTIAWETAAEENVMWHIIERSEDGRDGWTEMGRMISKSAGNQGAIYEMIDSEPFNNTYYRLKTVDYDNSFQLSPVINIVRPSAEFESIDVYPNPVDDVVNFKIDSDREEAVSIRVVDLSGKKVAEYTDQVREGLNELSMSSAAWKSGIYFVQFRSKQAHVTRRIVKQE